MTLPYPNPATQEMATDVTLTAMDGHGLTFERTFTITFDIHADALLFTLDSSDSNVRDYLDTAFWESTTTLINEDATINNFMTQSGDARTQAYASTPLGSRVKLVAYIGSAVQGEAYYNVRPAYRSTTFQQLMVGTENVDFADKDEASSWASGATSFLVNANGNASMGVLLIYFLLC